MKSIGFGLERIAWAALERPRLAAVATLLAVAVAAFGATRLSFDEELRNIFVSGSDTYDAYKTATSEFADPENETLILVEGPHLGEPANFTRLRDFQFELQFIDGVDSVYSLFALREAPDESGNAPLLVNDATAGLTGDLAERIRAHPILGDKLLSDDGRTMLFVLTPSEAEAPLSVARALKRAIDDVANRLFQGTDITATVTGFPTIRAEIVEVIRRDQVILNVTGAIIGLIVSLIVFRSLTAAAMSALPAIGGGLTVLGFMGLSGLPVTVMSTVVPAIVMILGFADGMHLCFSWRRHRDAGASVREAEMLAQREVGGACMLAAITTAVAFASLVISSVPTVRNFGIMGIIGVVAGTVLVLVAHGLLALAIGRFWKGSGGPARNFLAWLAGPCGAIGEIAVRHSRTIGMLSVVALVGLSAAHFSVPPQHSVAEHLPAHEPANAALIRIDQKLGGIYPVQILVPLDGQSPTAPEALSRIGAVHRAVAGIDGVSSPMSLWSLAEWLGGTPEEASRRIGELMDDLSPANRARFLGQSESALITATVSERPTDETLALVNQIDRAAKAAGGDDVVTTGFTVLNAREGTRTISNLNISLFLSVVADLAIIALAFRSVAVGVVSFLPNFLPIVAIGTFLFLTGRGMQFTSVIALTVAFGIAVDDSVHFLNRLRLTQRGGETLSWRLVETSRQIGPVLIGTTLVIIAGISMTLTSGLPTVSLFGWIAAMALAVAIIGDLVVLPALISGFAARWFDPHPAVARSEKVAA